MTTLEEFLTRHPGTIITEATGPDWDPTPASKFYSQFLSTDGRLNIHRFGATPEAAFALLTAYLTDPQGVKETKPQRLGRD